LIDLHEFVHVWSQFQLNSGRNTIILSSDTKKSWFYFISLMQKKVTQQKSKIKTLFLLKKLVLIYLKELVLIFKFYAKESFKTKN